MGYVWVEARLVNSINTAELKTLALVNMGTTYSCPLECLREAELCDCEKENAWLVL